MSHLRPEQRADKNGKVVTRRVRFEAKAARGKAGIPAPPMPSSPGPSGRPWKPRPKQVEAEYIGLFLPVDRAPSQELWDTPDEAERIRSQRHSYGAEVSQVQFYDVASTVASPSDALKLVSLGARSAEDARAILAERRAERLSVDMDAAARRALETNVHPQDFIQLYGLFAGDGRDPADVVDAVRFATTSLEGNEGFGAIAHAIAAGDISFEDIRAVGVTRLKSRHRLANLEAVFRKLRNGNDDDGALSVEGLKRVLTRADEEGLGADYRQYNLGRLIELVGTKRIEAVRSVKALVEAFGAFVGGIGRPVNWTEAEAAEHALYHASLGDAVTSKDRNRIWESAVYHDAGIPAGIAREVILSGGTVTTAQGIVDHGVATAVAEGWL